MSSNFEIDPYDPCPCGSGKKYKFCCRAAAPPKAHGKYPVGTVAYYGPDDKTTTKIAAGVVRNDRDEHPVMQRWTGDNVTNDPAIMQEIKHFFAKHGVKNVVVTQGNLGCPHEEGIDFPEGGDCPLCPFWAGKQGSGRRDTTDDDFDNADDGVFDDDDDENDAGAWHETNRDDYPERIERVQAIVGNDDDYHCKAIARVFSYLETNLQFPFEVCGIEDFQWEEGYVFGGLPQDEYNELKKTQPSYSDKFQLLGISTGESSEWMMFSYEDIAAHVRRISDGKVFTLGLAELEAIDKASPNGQLLLDYAV